MLGMENVLKPGRELDEKVAEKVMGWKRELHSGLNRMVWKGPPDYDATWSNEPKPYSTDIAAAWPIAEKFHILVQPLESGALAIIEDGVPDRDMQYIDIHRNDVSVWVVGETAPHVICLAALKAVGG